MSDDQLRSALASLDGPAEAPGTSHAALTTSRRRRARRRGAAVIGAVAAIALVVGVVVWSPWMREAPVPADPGPTTAPTSSAWDSIAEAPLSARTGTASAWTGTEMLVAGGVSVGCPPGADCAGYTEDQVLADGAAYDPATDSWRSIAPAPVALVNPISVWTGEVWVVLAPYLFVSAGGNVQVSGDEQHLLTYDPQTDVWTDSPAWAGTMFDRLTMAGDDLLVLSSSGDALGERDQVYDLGTHQWEMLPRDPFGAGMDRSLVWTGDQLVLAEIDDEVGATYQLATLEPGADAWTALDATEVTGWGTPWWWFQDRVVDAAQESLVADGSANPSGALDLATGTWESVPQTDVDPTVVCQTPAIGVAGDWLAPGDGVLVSLEPAIATTMPGCGGQLPSAAVWTGTAFVIWGGTGPDAATPTALGSTWTPPTP